MAHKARRRAARLLGRRLIVTAALALSHGGSVAATLTPDAVYRHFDLRSIYSAIGPRLTGDCHRYLRDDFPAPAMLSTSDNKLVLDHGGDTWVVTIVVDNAIRGGTDRSSAVDTVTHDAASGDWRASEAAIALPGHGAAGPRTPG